MCGIVGYIGPRQAAGLLIDGLRRMEYRGYDSAGLAIVNGHGLEVVKAAGQAGQPGAASCRARRRTGTLGIGHTRWATHGAPTTTNAHPHTDQSGRIAVIHNGIIENAGAHPEGARGPRVTYSSRRPTPRCWRTWSASSTPATSRKRWPRRCAMSTAPTASPSCRPTSRACWWRPARDRRCWWASVTASSSSRPMPRRCWSTPARWCTSTTARWRC